MMKSFKYKGTPEKMAKVAEWCITNRSGVFMEYQDITNDVCYFDMEDWYRKSEKEELTPALELEIFGKTSTSLITEDAWKENTGDQPDVPDGTLVDTTWEGGHPEFGNNVDHWHWAIGMGITHWRFHKPEDAKYYQQPATEHPKPKKPMCLEDAYDTPTYTDKHYMEDVKAVTTLASPEQPKRNKYMREIRPGVFCDVYDVIRAFNVTDGALQHLLKKALAVGQRGHKDAATDYKDIEDSAKRAREIFTDWATACSKGDV